MPYLIISVVISYCLWFFVINTCYYGLYEFDELDICVYIFELTNCVWLLEMLICCS